MQWYNEPPRWQQEDNHLIVRTGPDSDYWRVTHYGFIRDSGHFYYQEVQGDFTAEVKITGQYEALYDQAGLMLRLDEFNWLKCGIEYVEGVQNVSTVVTRDYSDWSVTPLQSHPSALWLRLSRKGDTVEVHYSLDGNTYSMQRLAYFPVVPQLQVGIMCASPDGPGYSVTFEDFKVNQ
ncbi:MAG TPA: DUF1349 domain-containing protein [Chloroflexia bacterium]|nr:DUF1349 domain-containing protein [Chloroflexia bacterium]